MASKLSQFHYLASQVPQNFEFEREGFLVNEIYTHYALKHERTPVSLFADKMFAQPLENFATDSRDYEHLYVKMKKLAHLINKEIL